MKKLERQLPIEKYHRKIMKMIKSNKCTIICGETGCGKTTQVPQYLLNSKIPGIKSQSIAITQPRRVAAITVAQRVASELNSEVGDIVGYSIRFENCCSENTRIKYLTDGMLLREAILDPFLKEYKVIIIDEVHERSVNTDVCLGLLKELLQKRRGLKIVLMSATIDIHKLSTYFNTKAVMEMEGRIHPVELYYTMQAQLDYVESALSSIIQIHISEGKGDILVFLTGQDEIEDLEELLQRKNPLLPPKSPKMQIVPLYAALPSDLQLLAFESCLPGSRKIILATNIAETSITIENIKYVIDCGFLKSRYFVAEKMVDCLRVTPVSKNSAVQRAGRAGRDQPGKCLRLYREEDYKSLTDSAIPEILRVNLANVALQLMHIGIINVHTFDFLDKPHKESWVSAYHQLFKLAAIDKNLTLTTIGNQMAILPTPPVYSRLILTSLRPEFDSVRENILIIVAMLSVENVFYVPRNKGSKYEEMRKRYMCKEGDHISLMRAYKQYMSKKTGRKEFAREHYLNGRSIEKAGQILSQLYGYVSQIERQHIEEGDLMDDLMDYTEDENTLTAKCLCKGLYLNYAYLTEGSNKYKTQEGGQLCLIHPSSALFKTYPNTKQPYIIIYSNIILTSKKYITVASPIQKEWIQTTNIHAF